MNFLIKHQKLLVNGAIVLTSLVSMALTNKSDDIARTVMKEQIKKEILEELSTNC